MGSVRCAVSQYNPAGWLLTDRADTVGEEEAAVVVVGAAG